MHFRSRTRGRRYDVPARPTELPCLYLLHTDWDDFGYRTSYDVHFFNAAGEHEQLESVKILEKGALATSLPVQFEALDDRFFSLGGSLQYYQRLQKALGPDATSTFAALRDVVAAPDLVADARATAGFDTSLLRYSEAEKAFHEGGRYFGRVDLTSAGFAFTFECGLNGFTQNHSIPFTFTRHEDDKAGLLPRRLVCFVGKNGTGKSGVLARLAGALSGHSPGAGSFAPGRPRFSRTICISYSVFQPFAVPVVDSFSYRYCGLLDPKGRVDAEGQTDRTATKICEVMQSDRREDWRDYAFLHDVSGRTVDESQFSTQESARSFLDTLSSGQRMVLSIATDVICNVSPQSLILFDEPESYLHPTLLSTLLRMLERILAKYDSYAIVATHSPIVVQEVPARSIHVFEREGSVPILSELTFESFGAAVGEIVDQVFAMNPDDKNYQSIFRAMDDRYDAEAIRDLFAGRLSVNALLFLRSLQEA